VINGDVTGRKTTGTGAATRVALDRRLGGAASPSGRRLRLRSGMTRLGGAGGLATSNVCRPRSIARGIGTPRPANSIQASAATTPPDMTADAARS
jgi:hypothetical protein